MQETRTGSVVREQTVEDLLEQVARERYQRLVAHATLVSASPSDAQDLVQESLIAAFSGRARFGSVEQAEAYVVGRSRRGRSTRVGAGPVRRA